MAQTTIKAIITAEDKASPVINGFAKGVDNSGKSVEGLTSKLRGSTIALGAVTAGASLALNSVTNFVQGSLDAANKYQAAFTGLRSVSTAFGQDATKAEKAARELSSDGLMPVTDAARGLKNLLASGFSLDQATTLMKRFKDSAAFGRQSALSFGDAVASATEGIKNGNSILVDNAGVTKNLSVILEEAGFSAQDVMKATTDVNVRMALFNGILKETNPQLGDAAKLSDSFAGEQSKLATKITETKVAIGEALQPVLEVLFNKISPIIDKLGKWAKENPKLVATLTAVAVALLAVGAAIAGIGTILAIVIGLVGGWVALIIAAVVAAGVAIIMNWDKVKNFFLSMWQTVKDAFSTAINFMLEKFIWLKDNFWSILGEILGFFATLPIKLPFWMAEAMFKVVQAIVSIRWSDVFRSILDGFKTVGSWIIDAAKNIWKKLTEIDWGGFFLGIGKSIANAVIELVEGALKGALKGLPGNLENKINLPRFADGVRNFGGGMAVVGERGPELVNLPRGSDVIPNSRSGLGSVNITIQAGAFMGSQQDARKYATMIMGAYSDAMLAKGMRA